MAKIRKLFPYLNSGKIYFNHASTGVLSERVKNRIKEFIDERSIGKIINYDDFLDESADAKLRLGRMLNCNSDRLAWIDNVSNAMNILAQGIEWEKGDRIILLENDFPSTVYPFLNLRKLGVEIDFVETEYGIYSLDDLFDKVTSKTKLISLSLVSFLSGFRSDAEKIGEFCKANNITFSLDAIQGAGVVNIDIEKFQCDFLAGGTHKWLMSLQGLSFFYISEELQKRLNQKFVGWLSVEDAWHITNYDLTLKSNAEAFQNGTMNTLGVFAINESLKLFEEFGFAKIEDRILANTNYFISELLKIGFVPLLKDYDDKNRSGIVSIKTENYKEIMEELKKENIWGEIREGLIRFSPHFYNTKEEIDKVIYHLSKIKS